MRFPHLVDRWLQLTFLSPHLPSVLDVIDSCLKHIFNGIKTRFAKEIEIINLQFPAQEFIFPEKTVILKFTEGIKILQESGVEVGDYDDLRYVNLHPSPLLGRAAQ